MKQRRFITAQLFGVITAILFGVGISIMPSRNVMAAQVDAVEQNSAEKELKNNGKSTGSDNL